MALCVSQLKRIHVERATCARAATQRGVNTVNSISRATLQGPARWSLVALAQLGTRFTLYHELGDEADEQTLVFDDLRSLRHDNDCRVRVSEYAELWRIYYVLLTGRASALSGADIALIARRKKGDQ